MLKNHLIVSYLLGLLAKIKCSICSYQLNLWYVDNCRLWVLSVFFKQSIDQKCDVVLGLETCTFSLDLCKLPFFSILCDRYSQIMLLKYHWRLESKVLVDNAYFIILNSDLLRKLSKKQIIEAVCSGIHLSQVQT